MRFKVSKRKGEINFLVYGHKEQRISSVIEMVLKTHQRKVNNINLKLQVFSIEANVYLQLANLDNYGMFIS